MVEEALQAMILPLQTARRREAERQQEEERPASCPAAGVREAQPEGRGWEEAGRPVIRVDSSPAPAASLMCLD